MARRWLGVVFCLLLAPTMVGASPTPDGQDIRIGVLAYRGAERTESEWDSTFAHLSAFLPQYHFRAIPGDLTSLTAAVAAEQLDFIITNPGHYVELEAAHGVARIATALESGTAIAAQSIGAAVLVPAGQSTIQTLADLRGKRVVAVTPDSFGFRIALRDMAEAGFDPLTQASLSFVGFPIDDVVAALRQGHADAGIVRTCLLEQMIAEGKLRRDEMRVIAAEGSGPSGCLSSTRLYPAWPFARLSHTPEPLAKHVAMALLAMPALGAGPSWTVPVDYQSVHDLYRALKIGPYQGGRRRSLADLVWENRLWAALFLLTLLWGMVHVVRVEQLVRRRTAELRTAHEEARRRGEEMEHAVRLSLVGEMASSLAHEINQPLAAIVNYARGCERRLEAGTDLAGVGQGVRQIAGQAERAAAIVRRMREFVRKRPVPLVTLDLTEVIHETLQLFLPVAHRRNVEVEVTPSPVLPPVRADRIQLEEVLLNLLQNAADAVAGQGDRRIQLSVAAVDSTVRVTVADNGPGLSRDVQARLFEAFFTTKTAGLGLGLSLSRSIIEAHGGRLWGDSPAQGGAVFTFALPIVTAEGRHG